MAAALVGALAVALAATPTLSPVFPMPVGSRAQSFVSMASYDGGFKLIVSETDSLTGELHGVDFGPNGFSADTLLWPIFGAGGRIACDSTTCAVASFASSDGGPCDGIRVDIVSATGSFSSLATTVIPDPLNPSDLALAKSGADWLVADIDDGYNGVTAWLVSIGGVVVSGGSMLENGAIEYRNIVAVQSPTQTWLKFAGENSNGVSVGRVTSLAPDDVSGFVINQPLGPADALPAAVAEGSTGSTPRVWAGHCLFRRCRRHADAHR